MPTASRLFRNWRLKLSALALSIFLWAVVQAEPNNSETFSAVPVEVQIADTSWVLAGPTDPPVVQIRLGGVAREIIRLAQEGTTLRIPVASVTSRDTVIGLRTEWVEAAGRAGVIVESVSPASVRLTFEPAASRLVPVAPRVAGRLQQGLTLLGGINANPQFVRVRGPASRVDGLDSMRLRPLDLGGVRQSGIFTVPVDTTGLLGGTAQPATVTLSVRVEEILSRAVPGVAVRVDSGEGEPELVSEPATVQVRIVGPRSLVTGLDLSRLQAVASSEALQGMAEGEVRTVPVRVEGAPAGVTAEPLPDLVVVRRAQDVGPSGGGS
jgi:YbbR domain-containing protein